MHGQIIHGLYTTLINLIPTTHREGTKQKKKREKERGAQAIIITPLRCRREGYDQLMEEPSMTRIPKPNRLESREFPYHHSSDRRCNRTPATPTQTPAQGSAARPQSAPAGPPHWTPLMAVELTWPSVNSMDGDSAIARGRVSSDLPYTRP
jgi:hypothetical protein